MTTDTDRLPFPADPTPEQRAAIDRITAGPRGGVSGPFVPLLRSPELMTRLQLVGETIRFGGVLDEDLVEVVVLTVARHWDQPYEWAFHHPIALAKGVPPADVEAVGRAERPSDGRLAVMWDVVDELQRTKDVSDATYAEAVAVFGEERVVAAVATAGYYTTLAMVMNTARTPPPEGLSAALPEATPPR
ncbi:carboxymuconolactone decarboxylase family protein [Herbidospora sp. NEAU-GS84]|uniref:Carboxymuconolactone decarboxylase family protein n=1 Tax=Herbidospora solisilvae TaxID=2696284 RepID=A0A7C9J9R5_9ACTN|nr:carboxymuconolactone decarboxylase family protein [Herbidospora solisilvae]NAS23808.1 carboxymuconolactone decarboxylase family protein [Herbidospora solisilvae]